MEEEDRSECTYRHELKRVRRVSVERVFLFLSPEYTRVSKTEIDSNLIIYKNKFKSYSGKIGLYIRSDYSLYIIGKAMLLKSFIFIEGKIRFL